MKSRIMIGIFKAVVHLLEKGKVFELTAFVNVQPSHHLSIVLL